MKAINITVRNKIAKNLREYDTEYICGNSDFVVVFDFDEEWDAFDVKTARFKYNGTHRDVIFTGNQVDVPIIENTHLVSVGVFAGNLHTTTPALFTAKKSILCGSGVPAAPPDDVYNQIIDMVQRCLDNKPDISEEEIQRAVDEYLDKNQIDVGVSFETDHTLTLKDGILSVNTTDQMEQDNTLPITSAGVFATVGNIEALLKTI